MTQIGWTLVMVTVAGEFAIVVLARFLGGSQPLPMPHDTAASAFSLMFMAALLGEIALLCVSSRAAMAGMLAIATAGYVLLGLFPSDPVLAVVRTESVYLAEGYGFLIGVCALLVRYRRRNPNLLRWWDWWPRIRMTALYAGAGLLGLSALIGLGEYSAGLPHGHPLEGVTFWTPWGAAVLGFGSLVTGLPGWPAVSLAHQAAPRRLVWEQPPEPPRRRPASLGPRQPDVRP